MNEYKILKYWQCGNLQLREGQIVNITDNKDGSSLVSIKHYPEKNQLVTTKGIENLLAIKKIEKY